MNYIINIKSFKKAFLFPCFIIDKYIKITSGDFIKVLLVILNNDESQFTSEYLCEKTGLNLEKVDEAMEYWLDAGVLNISNNENANINTVDYNIINQPVQDTQSIDRQSVIEAPNPSKSFTNNKVIVRYTPSEIAKKCDENNDLKFLMENIQSILKRPINHTEQLALINLFEYYGFSVGIILMLFDYCEQIGKTKVAYAESIAKSWFERDIVTHEAVEKEIIRMVDQNTIENKIINAFGLEQKLTPKQKEFLNKWLSFGYDIEMISYAYEKCVDQTNKIHFPYINKIIETWAEKGYKNKNDVINLDEKQKVEKPQPKSHSYDLDEFYQIALNNTPTFKGE